MTNSPTVFEQVIILAQRTRELRDQRYGTMATGVFTPAANKRLVRTVDVAISEVDDNTIGREYLIQALDRTRDRRRTRHTKRVR
jgi:DNA-directed RNA polymerase subunit K/omega